MTGDFFTLKHSMCYSRCDVGFGMEGMRLIRRFASHNDKLTISRANYQTLPREVKDDTARYFDC